MSLKTNLWLAVSYRKPEVKIRVTWHLMFSKEKKNLFLPLFHFISSSPPFHPPFHSFSTPPHLFSFIHPPTTLHLINKVIYFTTKVAFVQLEATTVDSAAIWGFCSHLMILQLSVPAQIKNTVCLKFLYSSSHQ